MIVGAVTEPGSSELFRRDLHTEAGPDAPTSWVLAPSLASLATPDIDALDLYHGNQILDATLLPPLLTVLLKATEGARYTDPTFDTRVAEFRAAGVPRIGGYHWIRSDSPALAQWTNYLQALYRSGLTDRWGVMTRGGYIVLDWERTYTSPTTAIPDCPLSMVEEWLNYATRAFPGRVCVYGAEWVPGFLAWRAAHPEIPVWYPCYRLDLGPILARKYSVMMLQFSSRAQFPHAIVGNVDASICYDLAQLDRLAGTTPASPPSFPPPSSETTDMFLIKTATAEDVYLVLPAPRTLTGRARVHILAEQWADWSYLGPVLTVDDLTPFGNQIG